MNILLRSGVPHSFDLDLSARQLSQSAPIDFLSLCLLTYLRIAHLKTEEIPPIIIVVIINISPSSEAECIPSNVT